MKNERIALWDNLKFFLIFLVVLGHLSNQYFTNEMFGPMTLIIYTFHMPAFVFVSGLFSKRTIKSDQFPFNKMFVFFILYLITRVLNYASNIVFGIDLDFELLYCSNVSWYMFAMALWYPITWAIRKIDSKYILIVSIIAACFIGYQKKDNDFLVIQRLITFFPFFYCGYLFNAEKIIKITKTIPARVFSLTYISAFIAIAIVYFEETKWLYPLLTARRSYFDLEMNSEWGALLRLAYYPINALLIFSIVSLCPMRKTIFSSFGTRTIQIYVLHRPILFLMENFGLFLIIEQLGDGWEWIAIALIVVLVLLLCPKFWSKPFDYLLNPKISDSKINSEKIFP